MGQICSSASAPAAYMRKLPATLAAQNINHGLKARPEQDKEQSLLFHQNGSLVLRAAVSESYERIWNNELTARLLDLQEANPNWVNPMAYAISKPGVNGGWPTMTGGMVPSGLYASDHDMFAFLVDESKTLDGSPEGINRGIFLWNSEVGAMSVGGMKFAYDRVCGNNIVWGASDVVEFKFTHRNGVGLKAFHAFQAQITEYADSDALELEQVITKARKTILGANKAEVLDAVFGMAVKLRQPVLTRSKIEEAIDLAETREERYGDPYSVWGVVGGLTEASQFNAYTEDRLKVDKAAGKILQTIEF
jgi:hypothetical protein